MSNQLCFLLIHHPQNQHWVQLIQDTLTPLADVQLKTEKESYHLTNLNNYDLIMIDAAIESHVPQLIRHLHAKEPQARLIVMTASPTWRRAREVFRAGAIDYVRKSLDKEEILSTVQGALAKKLPALTP